METKKTPTDRSTDCHDGKLVIIHYPKQRLVWEMKMRI